MHMPNNSPLDKKKFPALLDTLHQEHWYLTKLLALLIVICMASLGSLSLAQHFLPQGPLVAATTPIPKYDDGRCDADPAQMTYVPLVPHSGSSSALPSSSNTSTPKPTTPINKKHFTSNMTNATNQSDGTLAELSINSVFSAHSQIKPTPTTPPPTNPLPADWTIDGLNDTDAAYVQACAASFVKQYHTYDASNPQTFQNAIYMLSTHAKKLFYLGGIEDTDNIHLRTLPNWQQTAQKQQQIEQATVDRPIIHGISSFGSLFIVTVKVGYNLQKQTNGLVTAFTYNDTVILQNTTPSPKLPNEKTGWQVIDWKDQDA